jgi:hypothetical protein
MSSTCTLLFLCLGIQCFSMGLSMNGSCVIWTLRWWVLVPAHLLPHPAQWNMQESKNKNLAEVASLFHMHNSATPFWSSSVPHPWSCHGASLSGFLPFYASEPTLMTSPWQELSNFLLPVLVVVLYLDDCCTDKSSQHLHSQWQTPLLVSIHPSLSYDAKTSNDASFSEGHLKSKECFNLALNAIERFYISSYSVRRKLRLQDLV